MGRSLSESEGRRRFTWFACLLICLLAACGGDKKSDLDEYIDDVNARKAQSIEPLPDPKVIPKFSYRPLTRISPFLPVPPKKIESMDENFSPDVNRLKQPLESYPLDSLAMVGKVHISGVRWALIESADNHVHRIRVGQYMGKNYGRVIEIAPKRITLEETVRIANKWQKRSASLKLRIGEGE